MPQTGSSMSFETAVRIVPSPESQRQRPVVAVTGLNHLGASIELREKFAFSPAAEECILSDLLHLREISEVVLLSTCNRMEIVVTETGGCTNRRIAEAVGRCFGLRPGSFAPLLYHLHDQEAVEHLFRVASGLDSMMLGEPQILGQLKRAYRQAQARGTTSALLNRVFQSAFRAAKAVRTQTEIGRNAVSVSYAGRELARQIFGELNELTVMIFGAGETAELALKNFQTARQVFVANKTISRAASLAEPAGGVALDFVSCRNFIHQADVIIGAANLAGTDLELVTSAEVQEALRRRQRKPQLYLDFGVPRNFPSAIAAFPDAFLFNIDDLGRVVEQNMKAREEEKVQAEVILKQEVCKFLNWTEQIDAAKSIAEVRERHARFEHDEIAKTMRILRRKGLTDEQCRTVELCLANFSRGLLNKVLHHPLAALKESGFDDELLSAFRALFLGS